MKTPEIIYLIPANPEDPNSEHHWCEDPDPEQGMKKEDAVMYRRVDTILEIMKSYEDLINLMNELDK